MEDAMDRLEAMSILVAAVESGSLTAASRKLGAPLPTVSRKVAELEAHLGTRLLIRSTRRLTLTEAGLAYVTASKRILQQVEEVERAASGEYSTPRGDLIVTAPVVCGRLHVLPVVTDFLAAYPDISVRLSLSDRNAHLVDDHIDLAVRIGTLPDSSMVATGVGWASRVVCGSPAYFAAHGVPKHPADLADLACISFDVLNSPTAWNFATPGAKGEQTVAVRSRLSVNTAEAAIDAAVAGAGVTRVLSGRPRAGRGPAADRAGAVRVSASPGQSGSRAGADTAEAARVPGFRGAAAAQSAGPNRRRACCGAGGYGVPGNAVTNLCGPSVSIIQIVKLSRNA
jgi:DNA-binding transcriptional LysR family regulator